jgi:cyclic-di-AMP phosphodiesterase PgpH
VSPARFTRKKGRAPGGGSLAQQQGRSWWRRLGSRLRENRMLFLVFGLTFPVLVALVTPWMAHTAQSAARISTEGFAPETIRAEFRFKTMDVEQTRQAQETQALAVPDTYRVDQALVNGQIEKFDRMVEALDAQKEALGETIRDFLEASTPDQNADQVVRAAVLRHAELLAGQPPYENVSAAHLATWLAPMPESVPSRVFPADSLPGEAPDLLDPSVPGPVFANADRLESMGRSGLEYVLNFGVLNEAVLMGPMPETTAQGLAAPRAINVLRDRPDPGQARSEQFTPAEAPVPGRVQRMLRDRVRLASAGRVAGDEADGTEDWTELQDAAYGLAQACLAPTLVLDAVTTEGQQEAARRAVEPVTKWIEKNERIQDGGYRWTEQSRSDYETYMAQKMSGQSQRYSLIEALFANMILVGLVMVCLVKVVNLMVPEARGDRFRNLTLVLLVMVGSLVFGRVVSVFDPSGFATPVAAGAILLAILLNTRIAATTSLLTAILLSVQFDYDWRILIVSLVMSLAGVFSVYKVRRRSDMGRAAVNAAIAGVIAVIAVTLARDTLLTDGPWRVLRVALNGMACLFIVPGLLPPLERLFRITTDIALLEYSDLNNELLSRLAIEVPATYAHSLMLGQLAEAACEEIGANGLLARVSAYYHDIGKLRRPEYFAENQSGQNVHDSLKPHMSARTIRLHVLEGAEMAREFHLPKPLIDAIYEHHGTCMISFFYQQAREQARHEEVSEKDFRYPGPKPQSPETAILMICDACESAVRSLKTPTEERIRDLVKGIVTSRSEDRQFDECDLTLRDLDTIGDVVSRRLVSNLHSRIQYPTMSKAEKRTGHGAAPPPAAAPATPMGEHI